MTTLVMDLHGRRWLTLLLHATGDQRCLQDRINSAHSGFSSIWVACCQPLKLCLYSFKFNVVLCLGESMFVDGEFLIKCPLLDCCSFTFGTIE